MKIICLIITLAFNFTAQSQTLVLQLGQSKNIPISQDALWVENKKIIKAQANGGSWNILGLQEGSTLVRSGPHLYQVHILHPKNAKSYEAINTELKKFIGLKLNIKDGKIVIEGRLYLWEEWLKLASFFKPLDIDYLFLAKISEKTRNKIQRIFDEQIQEQGLLPAKINFSEPPEVKISETNENFEKYYNFFKSYGITVTKNKNSIDLKPIIRLEMTLLEINKNLRQKYGFSWPESISSQALPDFTWKSFSAELNLLEQSGQAKILASPNILCRSGEEAAFLVGGEFPIKVSTKNNKQVIWKNYGISLKFKPKADSSGRMSVSIESEVSSIDSSLMVEGVPALRTNKVSSHFDLTKSSVVALSGLLKEDQGKHSEGLPGLSSIPILGSLFGSQNFQNNKSELIIFVKPSINNSEEATTSPLRHISVE